MSDDGDRIDDPRLTAYALGELTEAELAAFEEELASNPALQAELEDIQRFSVDVAAALLREATAPPASIAPQILPSVGAGRSADVPANVIVSPIPLSRARRRPGRRWSVLVPMALSLAAVTAVVLQVVPVQVASPLIANNYSIVSKGYFGTNDGFVQSFSVRDSVTNSSEHNFLWYDETNRRSFQTPILNYRFQKQQADHFYEDLDADGTTAGGAKLSEVEAGRLWDREHGANPSTSDTQSQSGEEILSENSEELSQTKDRLDGFGRGLDAKSLSDAADGNENVPALPGVVPERELMRRAELGRTLGLPQLPAAPKSSSLLEADVDRPAISPLDDAQILAKQLKGRRENLSRTLLNLDFGFVDLEDSLSETVVSPLPADQARLKAECNGRYSDLLDKIQVPQDAARYGRFHEFGHWAGSTYAGRTGLPTGYWVYVAPDWYIWRVKAEDKQNDVPAVP